ncbi:hypothetical protein [Flagellimonas eckloniae]|uniref:Uncharacterized protein n=1 Tax=Flagellimonas eckloniae TaxID=346185 RepID=A0A0Q0WWK3_9FLAO|nr:hypothetical protein [Allomuricauda eckloniae]KQC29841.1 hypothetical protein AAY42_08060 [Allomuricauda eckloniae]
MNKDKKSKKGKTIGIIVGMIAFALSYYGVQQLFKKDLESELENAALELNKQTPIQVDQFSRLDSASTKGKTNFIYHYTLFDLEKSEVNLDTVSKYIKPSLIENIKNSPELKFYRDNNIIMDYKYYDKKGALVTKISVTPELYK